MLKSASSFLKTTDGEIKMTHQNSLIFQNDIPAYRDASPDIRSQYDTIIESVDPGNPETVINFVAPALAELGSVATEIVEAHQNTSLQQEAMAAVEDLLVLLENVDPRSLRIELESATQKGVRFVKNNKIETAVAAGGLVTGNTTVTALAFLGIGLKNSGATNRSRTQNSRQQIP
ncbi:MAG: hypothetical protein R3D66_00920 [Alphaproteobacteria bacterium]